MREEIFHHKYCPDGMEGEQTWPTEEEILAAENKTRKVSPLVFAASIV